jgi:hypothetical protein
VKGAWIGGFLLCVGWVLVLPALGHPHLCAGLAAFIAGVVVYVCSLRALVSAPWVCPVWPIPVAAAVAVLTPWPWCVAPAVVALAATAKSRPSQHHMGAATALLVPTAVLAAQALVLAPALRLWCNWHSTPWLSGCMVRLLGLLRIPAGATGDVLYVGGMDMPLQISLAPERYG